MMRRAVAVAVLPLLALACAASFQERTERSLQTAVLATNAARDAVLAASKAAQESAVERLEADLAAIPEGPERPTLVAARKAQARAEVAEVRTKRDKALHRLEDAYVLLAHAAAVLPLVETAGDREQVLGLVREAVRALEVSP
jgi:vacuolar-type H+-ATPase subunit E/Vma4